MKRKTHPANTEVARLGRKVSHLQAEISWLHSRLEWVGERADVCVFHDIKRVCVYCQCDRRTPPQGEKP